MKNQDITNLQVNSNGCIEQMRTVTTGDEFKKETRTYAIKVFAPDMDVSGETDEIQDLCNETWTDEVKAAWAEFQESQSIGE